MNRTNIISIVAFTTAAAGGLGTLQILATEPLDAASLSASAYLGAAATTIGLATYAWLSRRRTLRHLREQFEEATRTGQPVPLGPGVTVQVGDSPRSVQEAMPGTSVPTIHDHEEAR